MANDDQQGVGAMLQTLQVRPSRRAYFFAALAAVAWVGGFAALIGKTGTDVPTLLANATPTELLLGAGALFGPLVFLFIAAMLAVRSQEMKLVARAVGEVAVRLTQPETFSTDAVLTVSQAVRREVAAVGDGIERALARAGELETLVRNEISTLERAYSHNEIRIRSLIDELVSQREAIVTNAERVRDAMSGSHQRLAEDLETSTRTLIDAVNGAGDRVTGLLEERGEQITHTLVQLGERIVGDMALSGSDLVERVSGTSEQVKSNLTEVGNVVAASLEERGQEITAALERTSGLLTRRLDSSASAVAQTLAETGRTLVSTLSHQGGEVRQAFEQTAQSLEQSFAARGAEVTDRLASTGGGIATEIAVRRSRGARTDCGRDRCGRGSDPRPRQ